MKRGMKLLLLLGALVLVLGAYLLLRGHEWEDDTKSAAQSVVLTDRAPAQIETLRWSFRGEECVLRQSEGVWADPDDGALPVDQDKAARLADAAAAVKSERALGAAARWEDYGLAQPWLRVELRFTDGSSAAFDLGDKNDVTGDYYAAFNGQVYMLGTALPEAFSLGRWDLIAPEELPEMTQPTAVEIRNGAAALQLVKEEGSARCYSEEYVWFCDTPDGLRAADTDGVLSLVAAVRALDLSDVAAYNVTDEELESWGLTEPAGRVTVRYQQEESARALTLELGGTQDGKRYARLEGSKMVYRLSDAAVEELLGLSYARDLLPDEVCRIDINSVKSLDVTLDGATRSVSGDALEAPALRSALAAIYAMNATATDGDPAQAGAALLTLTYHRDAGIWSDMTLTFRSCGEGYCLVEFNDGAYQLCTRSGVEMVMDFFREAFA